MSGKHPSTRSSRVPLASIDNKFPDNGLDISPADDVVLEAVRDVDIGNPRASNSFHDSSPNDFPAPGSNEKNVNVTVRTMVASIPNKRKPMTSMSTTNDRARRKTSEDKVAATAKNVQTLTTKTCISDTMAYLLDSATPGVYATAMANMGQPTGDRPFLFPNKPERSKYQRLIAECDLAPAKLQCSTLAAGDKVDSVKRTVNHYNTPTGTYGKPVVQFLSTPSISASIIRPPPPSIATTTVAVCQQSSDDNNTTTQVEKLRKSLKPPPPPAAPPPPPSAVHQMVERLRGIVMCCICHGILLDATSLVPCGHVLCATCVEKLIKGKCCPECRALVDQTIPNRHVSDIVDVMVTTTTGDHGTDLEVSLLLEEDVREFLERRRATTEKKRRKKKKKKKKKNPLTRLDTNPPTSSYSHNGWNSSAVRSFGGSWSPRGQNGVVFSMSRAIATPGRSHPSLGTSNWIATRSNLLGQRQERMEEGDGSTAEHAILIDY